MTQQSAQELTPQEFQVLASLIGPDGAREAVHHLVHGQLRPPAVDLLRSFLVGPMLHKARTGTLEQTLRQFRSADRCVQALALMGLRMDVNHRLDRSKPPHTHLRLLSGDTNFAAPNAENASRDSLLSILVLAEQAWSHLEAQRRARILIEQLPFPVRLHDAKTGKGIFGYTGEEELQWADLLAAAGADIEQQHIVETLNLILENPDEISPSRRRKRDGLPDITALLQDMLDLQRGVLLHWNEQAVAERHDAINATAPQWPVVSGRKLHSLTSMEVVNTINDNEERKARLCLTNPNASMAAEEALAVLSWRVRRGRTVPSIDLGEAFRDNEYSFINPTPLHTKDRPSPALTLESIQDQLLAYLRACETPEQLAEASRAILHDTLGEEWARRAAEAGTPEQAQRVLQAEVELAAEQGRRAAVRIADYGQTEEGELTSEELRIKEATLAALSSSTQSVLELASNSLEEVYQALWEEESKHTSFRVLAATELRRGASLLRELKTQNETGIVIRRSRNNERALIKPYREGDPFDDEASTNDLSTGGTLVTRAFNGERILIREGHGHFPLAVFAPTTRVVDAYLVRTGQLSSGKKESATR